MDLGENPNPVIPEPVGFIKNHNGKPIDSGQKVMAYNLYLKHNNSGVLPKNT